MVDSMPVPLFLTYSAPGWRTDLLIMEFNRNIENPSSFSASDVHMIAESRLYATITTMSFGDFRLTADGVPDNTMTRAFN